jgi:hypothetical protein
LTARTLTALTGTAGGKHLTLDVHAQGVDGDEPV